MADIYDIVEKVHEVKSTVDKIEVSVNQLKELQAVHNHILNEHHSRSTKLEETLKPIQEDYIFRLKFTKFAFGSAGLISLLGIITGIVVAISKFISNH